MNKDIKPHLCIDTWELRKQKFALYHSEQSKEIEGLISIVEAIEDTVYDDLILEGKTREEADKVVFGPRCEHCGDESPMIPSLLRCIECNTPLFDRDSDKPRAIKYLNHELEDVRKAAKAFLDV